MTSTVLIMSLSFHEGGTGFLYCYNFHIIHVNKTRSNRHKRNKSHIQIPVVLDGSILDTLHEGTTSANSENTWVTFLKRFFSGKSLFDIQYGKKSVEPFTKAFVISDDNRPAVIQTDTPDTREHTTLSGNSNDNFSQRAYIYHPFAAFFLGNIFRTHAR